MSALFELDGPQVVTASSEIGDTSFGTKYTAYRALSRFEEQTDDLDYGMIHWPGGNLSEKDDGRFGFEHKGLFEPSSTKPDLSEVFEYAFDNDIAVTITLPTQKYQDTPDSLIDGARTFLEDLHSGEFGPLPDKLIIEIGNEYYDVFEGADEVSKAVDYAAVVNTYTDVISEVEARFDVDPDQVEYTVQTGLNPDASLAILETLSDDALLNTDYLSHHRYPFEANGADDRIDDTAMVLGEYEDAIEDLGGEAPALFVSEYNTASVTRGEAANKYVQAQDDPNLTRDDIDLEGRTNLDFERFYQDQLEIRDYGMEQAENILQIFSEYQGIGAEAFTSYGWDSIHAGRHSLQGSDGENYMFVGGSIQDMMAESLHGTRVLDWYQDNDHRDRADDEVSAFGFDSADKLVIFLTAPEDKNAEMSYDIPLDGLGDVQSVWGESMTAAPPENWHELFDIPDLDGVDQSAEAETFSVASREEFVPDIDDGFLTVRFDEPGEVIRLVFARSDAGQDQIEDWHGTNYADIDGVVAEVDLDPAPAPTETDPVVTDISVPEPATTAPEGTDTPAPTVDVSDIPNTNVLDIFAAFGLSTTPSAPPPNAAPDPTPNAAPDPTPDPVPDTLPDTLPIPTIPAVPDTIQWDDDLAEDETPDGPDFMIEGILGALLTPILIALGLN